MSLNNFFPSSVDDGSLESVVGLRRPQQHCMSMHDQLSAGPLANLEDAYREFRAKYLSQLAGDLDLLATNRKAATVDAVVPKNSFRSLRASQSEEASGAATFQSQLPQGLGHSSFNTAQQNPGLASLQPSLHALAFSKDVSVAPASEGFGFVPFYSSPSSAGAATAQTTVNNIGGLQMPFATSSPTMRSQMLPPGPYTGAPPPLNPAALARQHRATEDSKRGKRRRPSVEISTSGMGDAEACPAQVVPCSRSAPDPKRSPAVKLKEERRKRRLLRNRVSAQQARERKRQQITELEEKCNKMEETNGELEQQIRHLSRDNEDLRQIVRLNMRMKSSTSGISEDQQQATKSEAVESFSTPLTDAMPIPTPTGFAAFGNFGGFAMESC